MYRSLLVPLDGSTFGEHALPLALSIARRAGASVKLVQVHAPLSLMYPGSISPFADEAEADVREQKRAYLDGLAHRLATASSVSVTSALVDAPVIAETLQEHAAKSEIDLIVMTTHGRGPLSRFWLGSVADEMVRRATTPILLVRPQEQLPDFTAELVLRHILVPLDGSALAEHVLRAAGDLGSVMHSEYTLLRVYGPLVESDLGLFGYARADVLESVIEQLRAEAQDYLSRVTERLKGQGLEVHTQAVLGNPPASAILETAQRLAVDLIALETHGRRGLPRLLLGSVADKVIRGASVPVFVHHSSPVDSKT